MNSLTVREAHFHQQATNHKGGAIRVLVLRRLSAGVSRVGLWGRVGIGLLKAANHATWMFIAPSRVHLNGGGDLGEKGESGRECGKRRGRGGGG